jgi:hypothetical protein
MVLDVLHLFFFKRLLSPQARPRARLYSAAAVLQLHGTPFRVSAVPVTILRAAGDLAGT